MYRQREKADFRGKESHVPLLGHEQGAARGLCSSAPALALVLAEHQIRLSVSPRVFRGFRYRWIPSWRYERMVRVGGSGLRLNNFFAFEGQKSDKRKADWTPRLVPDGTNVN